jgi:hypothetical protein
MRSFGFSSKLLSGGRKMEFLNTILDWLEGGVGQALFFFFGFLGFLSAMVVMCAKDDN